MYYKTVKVEFMGAIIHVAVMCSPTTPFHEVTEAAETIVTREIVNAKYEIVTH